MARIFSDPSKIDVRSALGRSKFFGAINAFIAAPQQVGRQLIAAGVREFTSPSDFPAEVKALIEKYHVGIEEVDLGYERVFNVRDFTQTRADGFKVRDVSSGLTFSKVLPGKKAKIYKVTGTEVSVGFDTYGGGLEYLQSWFDDNSWWMIEDQTLEFRAKWYQEKAEYFYGLIDAIGAGQNMAWAAGLGALERDILTINAACALILTDLRTAGMVATPNAPFVILAPIQLMGRINHALASGYSNAAVVGGSKVEYNVSAVYTLGLASPSVYYVALPGRKAVAGNRMNLTVYSELDIEAFATKVVGWGRYGGAIGEVDQFQRCATA